jgi:SPX domain protein involved in polyphosphate accumulation
MSNIKRYEIKLPVDDAGLSRFLSWLYRETTIRPAYEDRNVNSLYFDDTEFLSVRENLAGISNRKKLRLRWYHLNDEQKISNVSLEEKAREGRLGHKNVIKIPSLEKDLLRISLSEIQSEIWAECTKTAELAMILDRHFVPTIHLNYLRKYFTSANGVRITIDQDIRFYPLSPVLELYKFPAVHYPKFVIEIKFEPHLKNEVERLIRKLNMTPKRHSKYLAGLAALGHVNYV